MMFCKSEASCVQSKRINNNDGILAFSWHCTDAAECGDVLIKLTCGDDEHSCRSFGVASQALRESTAATSNKAGLGTLQNPTSELSPRSSLGTEAPGKEASQSHPAASVRE